MGLQLRARLGGELLIGFALIIVAIEVALHVISVVLARPYVINFTMLVIALIMGFVGMFILNPKQAITGGQFLVDNTIKIVQVFKAGRRKTDPLVAVLENANGRISTMVVPAVVNSPTPLVEPESTPMRRKTDTPTPTSTPVIRPNTGEPS